MPEVLLASVLIVTSKVKKHIKETYGLSTSSTAITKISQAVEGLCRRGVENAKAQKRKTVMDKDIQIDHL